MYLLFDNFFQKNSDLILWGFLFQNKYIFLCDEPYFNIIPLNHSASSKPKS